MNDRRREEGRYAKVEREQRWTVGYLPADARRTVEILDRYIFGTCLRLGRVETNRDVVLKLGQKIRADVGDPEVVNLTNMYLSAAEYDVLAALPAAEVFKTRWKTNCDGITVKLGIDEVRIPSPHFAALEVTNDDRFSGGALAFASDEALSDLLSEAGCAG